MKNVSFGAESDVGEGYMVIFEFYYFHSDLNCDFWEKDEIS